MRISAEWWEREKQLVFVTDKETNLSYLVNVNDKDDFVAKFRAGDESVKYVLKTSSLDQDLLSRENELNMIAATMFSEGFTEGVNHQIKQIQKGLGIDKLVSGESK